MEDISLPRVANWYRNVGEDRLFKVIDIDEDNRAIDIQYADGNLRALDFDEWSRSDTVLAQPPADLERQYDALDEGDLGYSQTRSKGEQRARHQSLDDLPPGAAKG